MRAVICRSFGPVAALQLEEVPAPEVASGTVAIDVAAAGVNFPDGLIVQGKYQAQLSFPFVPGSEAAGIVRAVGAGVGGFRPGDRVATFCGIGGYAQQVVAPAAQVYALPETLGFATAAGFLIAYGTSYHALKDRARLKAGETLLVLGAAGGVGKNIDEPRGIETQRLAQRQSLAQRLVIDEQRQIDGELHAGARAHRTDVLHAAAQVIEYGPGPFHVGRLAADKTDQLPFLGGSDGAADRALDERGAFRADLRREHLLGLGANGAHVDKELPAHLAG